MPNVLQLSPRRPLVPRNLQPRNLLPRRRRRWRRHDDDDNNNDDDDDDDDDDLSFYNIDQIVHLTSGINEILFSKLLRLKVSIQLVICLDICPHHLVSFNCFLFLFLFFSLIYKLTAIFSPCIYVLPPHWIVNNNKEKKTKKTKKTEKQYLKHNQ